MVEKAIFGFLFALFITFNLVPIFIEIGRRWKILDNPDGNLKQHKAPTPYLGGAAVFGGVTASLALVFPFHNTHLFFFLGITVLLLVGLLDDLVVLAPRQKFFGQVVAMLCFLKGGFYLKEQFLTALPMLAWPILWLAVSGFWILTMINAFNLIDIMDGLATTTALCLCANLGFFAYFTGAYYALILILTLAGALCAFLYYNKPLATIYLGDAGSLFVGGFLAVVPFMIHWGEFGSYGFLVPVVLAGIPLIEVLTLVIVRSYKRIPFWLGSPDHFAIILKRNGWSVPFILLYIVMASGLLQGLVLLVVFSQISVVQAAELLTLGTLAWYAVLFAPLSLWRVAFFRTERGLRIVDTQKGS